MATIIESLAVEVGLDPAKYVQGRRVIESEEKKVRDAAAETSRDVQDANKQNKESFSGLAEELLTFYAILKTVGGFKDFLQGVINTGVQTGRMATMTGESTKELGAWRNVAEQAGVSADDLTSSFLSIAQQLETFRFTGQSTLVPYLRALGISLTDAKGHAKTAGQITLELAGNARLHAMPPVSASYLLTQMGYSAGIVALLLKGRKNLEDKLAVAGKTTPSDADAAAALKYTDALAKLQQQAQQTGRTLLTDLAGPLGFLIDLMTKASEISNAILKIPGTLANDGAGKAAHDVDKATWGVGGKTAGWFGRHFRIRDGQLDVSVGGFQSDAAGSPRTTGAVTQAAATKQALRAAGAVTQEAGVSPRFAAQPVQPDALLELVRRLEGSRDNAISLPQGTGHGGAIGRFQVTPATARAYGRDPAKLFDPAYNEATARIILADLSKRYRGNLADILIGYNSTPEHVSRFNNSGGDLSTLLPETQRYLRHARQLMAGFALQSGAAAAARAAGKAAAASSTVHNYGGTQNTNTAHTQIGKIDVVLPNAKSSDEIASGLLPALDRHIFASMANAGPE